MEHAATRSHALLAMAILICWVLGAVLGAFANSGPVWQLAKGLWIVSFLLLGSLFSLRWKNIRSTPVGQHLLSAWALLLAALLWWTMPAHKNMEQVKRQAIMSGRGWMFSIWILIPLLIWSIYADLDRPMFGLLLVLLAVILYLYIRDTIAFLLEGD